eukprot:scaffold178327_cov10-Tisochrysis_lutea.AAC.1
MAPTQKKEGRGAFTGWHAAPCLQVHACKGLCHHDCPSRTSNGRQFTNISHNVYRRVRAATLVSALGGPDKQGCHHGWE